MRGTHQVIVRNSRVQFKFEVSRNITIIRGDSATGKTTLIGMIADYERNGAASGIELSCDVPCVVLEGPGWMRNLSFIHGSIVFVDEGNTFTSSHDFARAVRDSDNYYVIATRESLFSLPYSVSEVYGIRNSGRSSSRYPQVSRLYSTFYQIYDLNPSAPFIPELVVVEDSNAGFEFFSELFSRVGIPCVSAGGKGNVCRTVKDASEQSILVIADGAAFGPEMEGATSLGAYKRVRLFLPESFEWLVLNSGLIGGSDVADALANPSDHIESRDFFSWERFFTAFLVGKTRGTYLQYEKRALNPAYLQDREMGAIKGEMPKDIGVSL